MWERPARRARKSKMTGVGRRGQPDDCKWATRGARRLGGDLGKGARMAYRRYPRGMSGLASSMTPGPGAHVIADAATRAGAPSLRGPLRLSDAAATPPHPPRVLGRIDHDPALSL